MFRRFFYALFGRFLRPGGLPSLTAGNEEFSSGSEDIQHIERRDLHSNECVSQGKSNKRKHRRKRNHFTRNENESRTPGSRSEPGSGRTRQGPHTSKQNEFHEEHSAMSSQSPWGGRGRGRGRGQKHAWEDAKRGSNFKPKPKGQIIAEEKYEYFWTAQDIYSQWHQSAFKIGDQTYCCAEQYMMSRKAALFDDWDSYAKIMSTTEPRKMKQLGRNVRGIRHTTWKENAIRIIREGNIAKFSQNFKLRERLFHTFPKILVEASPYDRVWGIGLERGWEAAWDERSWKGLNLLGYVLTDVRNKLMVDNLENFTVHDLERNNCKVDMTSLQAKFKATNIDPAQEEEELSHDEAWKSDAGEPASSGDDRWSVNGQRSGGDQSSEGSLQWSDHDDRRSHSDGLQKSVKDQSREYFHGHYSDKNSAGSGAGGQNGDFNRHRNRYGINTENDDSQTAHANANSASGGNYNGNGGGATNHQEGKLRVVIVDDD